ncbi:asparagine synthase (glutamine-hydrolyzing) [Pedobacter africanus]|uniref:asparagine synthase (glutamine-hydrolyzing) n=1 Tax=Pedobacter africanus TaxID=151894 RepID=A0A1W2BTS9_9SPHI|nr:asparagine synthase (glutamine-hydrolyzing) [Pedobacter africanus]SMC76136.1 asparagine synthase (glutamine-hydrolysing) [Pedobacter africanus]
MCGIAGFLTKEKNINFDKQLLSMGEAIKYRGPDDFGVWFDENNGIGLSHRRLSILDLSPLGHQPMLSESRRYVMIFNGEIYNHLDLRKELSNRFLEIKWRGYSDTETVLKSIDLIGIESTVNSLIGMFAIALWDRENALLYLIRDRIGEKPLYYGWQGDTFLFGSELKALKTHTAFNGEIDKDALSLYFRYNYVPSPYSIYKGVSKLTPGSILTVSLNKPMPSVIKYWDLKAVISENNDERLQNNLQPDELPQKLDDLLQDAIKRQMMSDVPLGAFLSGGIDSSTIVGIMQSQSSQPIKTFTIGFDEKKYNEAVHAKNIAEYLKTDHTELYVQAKDTLAVIPKLPTMYDEPFADSSQIPTYLITKLAKRNVTVSLSGDAGDELFGGYNRYIIANHTWSKISGLPLAVRKLIATTMHGISPGAWNEAYALFKGVIPKKHRMMNFGDKMHKSSRVLASMNLEELYNTLTTQWSGEDNVVLGAGLLPTANLQQFGDLSNIESMMGLDMLTYLPDDVLVKVDRAAMANSLETRVPFLDHRIVEFAWQVPLNYKLKDGMGKWLLREVLYKYVPKELIERPKMGFSIPIDSWLRGPLKDWAEDLLDEGKMIQEGILNVKPIRTKWIEHLSGKRNWQHHLWTVLMFQAWYRDEDNVIKRSS